MTRDAGTGAVRAAGHRGTVRQGSDARRFGPWGGPTDKAVKLSTMPVISTVCVLEGLLEYEKSKGATTAVKDARLRGQEYLLERRMFRSRSTGGVIDPAWTQFSFPTRWHYDVLWGLDYLRRAGVEADERVAEAIDLVQKKRDGYERWPRRLGWRVCHAPSSVESVCTAALVPSS
jgi:hypothetical protein